MLLPKPNAFLAARITRITRNARITRIARNARIARSNKSCIVWKKEYFCKIEFIIMGSAIRLQYVAFHRVDVLPNLDERCGKLLK